MTKIFLLINKKKFLLPATFLLVSANFTVPPNVTTTQTLADDGDIGTIESNGTITVTGANGVNMANSNQTVTNAGTITVTGGAAFAINSTATTATITNSGTISSEATAILSTASGCSITNTGTASATDIAIGSTAANAVIFNFGTASSNLRAISSSGENAVIRNSGLAIGLSGGSSIFSTGTSAHIVNTGTLEGSVSISGSNGFIQNSGEIRGSTALFGGGDNLTIVNSGNIISTSTYALNLSAANPTLSLKNGSNIQGQITVTAAPLNVTVEKGLNLRLTIDDASNSFGVLNIDDPYVTVGNTETLAAVDRTGFSLQADVLEDLGDTVLDAIYRRKFDFMHCCSPRCGVWTQVLGSYRQRKETIHTYDWDAGGLVGVNWETGCMSSLGVFVGGTSGQAVVAAGTQKGDISTGQFGCTWENFCRRTFIGLAVTTGYVGWTNKRIIMNNLAPGGTQTARAKINGWILAPELSTAAWIVLGEQISSALSATFRYYGLYLGNYSESGSGADLNVHGRHVDLLKIRGELNLSSIGKCGCLCWNLEPYIGVAGRFQVGGRTVDSELLAQELDFATGGPYNLAEFLIGIRGEEQIGNYCLFGNVEGLFDNSNSSRVLAELGLERRF